METNALADNPLVLKKAPQIQSDAVIIDEVHHLPGPGQCIALIIHLF